MEQFVASRVLSVDVRIYDFLQRSRYVYVRETKWDAIAQYLVSLYDIIQTHSLLNYVYQDYIIKN